MSGDQNSLVQRAKGGDERAFGEIYERYQPAVYNYVYYRTGSSNIAEELTSEVFVRLVDKVSQLDEQRGPILAWLYTIARNLITDYYRRNGRVSWQPLEDHIPARTTETPLEAAERSFTRDALKRALGQLTELQRQVVLLKFMGGYTNAEVGAILGRDEGTVKSLQHRALAALRRVLQETLDEQ